MLQQCATRSRLLVCDNGRYVVRCGYLLLSLTCQIVPESGILAGKLNQCTVSWINMQKAAHSADSAHALVFCVSVTGAVAARVDLLHSKLPLSAVIGLLFAVQVAATQVRTPQCSAVGPLTQPCTR